MPPFSELSRVSNRARSDPITQFIRHHIPPRHRLAVARLQVDRGAVDHFPPGRGSEIAHGLSHLLERWFIVVHRRCFVRIACPRWFRLHQPVYGSYGAHFHFLYLTAYSDQAYPYLGRV